MEWVLAVGVSLFGGAAFVVGFWRGRKVTEEAILDAVSVAVAEVMMGGFLADEGTASGVASDGEFILYGDEDGFHFEEKSTVHLCSVCKNRIEE